MRLITPIVLLAAACQSKPKTTWEQDVSRFMIETADLADASGGDCDKLAAALEPLAPEAKAIRAKMDAAHKTSADYTPDPATSVRMNELKEPRIFDRCEHEPRANAAIDNTLGVIEPDHASDAN